MKQLTTAHRLRGRLSAALLAGAAAVSLAACSGGVVAAPGDDDGTTGPEVTLRLATIAQPGTTNAAAQDWFLDTLEERSGGRIVFDRFAPEVLCKSAEIVECVRDGRAEFGVSVPAYTPQYFPDEQVVGIPFLAYDGAAVMRAYYDAHFANDEIQAMYDDHGLTYVGMWPAGRLLFGSKEPIEGYEGLAGKQVRATGVGLQSAITVAGGDIVAVPQPDTYEAIQRGLVDVVGAPMDGPVNYKQVEVLPYWTDAGTGQYASFAAWMSKSVYDSLSEELRGIVDEVIEEFNTGAGWEAFNAPGAAQCEELLAAPTLQGLSRWSDEAVEAWRTALGDVPYTQWVESAKANGISDPETYFADYVASLERNATSNPEDATVDCIDAFLAKQ